MDIDKIIFHYGGCFGNTQLLAIFNLTFSENIGCNIGIVRQPLIDNEY